MRRRGRVTHAQPLVPGEEGRLDPDPLLSAAEAEVEAFVLNREGGEMFTLVAIGDLPVGLLSEVAALRLLYGDLSMYTHWLSIVHGPAHGCRDYLVRVEQ